MKAIRTGVVLALLIAGVKTAWAQAVVFDPTNYVAAIQRLLQLQQQYAQLVQTYQQIRAQYEHMVRMARQLPVDMRTRYKALAPGWRSSVAMDTYGTSGGWTTTVNTGDDALAGYQRATQPLRTYGAALAQLPADEQQRIKARYSTIELADASTVLGIQTVGRVRWRGPSMQATVHALEDDSFSNGDDMNTLIAVLNKINAAGVLALRNTQSTNQLLVSLLEDRMVEAKRQRDAEVAAINADIVFATQARAFVRRFGAGTTDAVLGFAIP